MVLDLEKLRHKARELALKHDPYGTRFPFKHVWIELNANKMSLRSAVLRLQNSQAHCSQPAEEWMLDNAEFIEEQISTIQLQLSNAFLRRLPRLRHKPELRIQSICDDYLESVDGMLDADTLVAYLNAYQEVTVLTIAELWSVPLLLKTALIRRLVDTMELVLERRNICEQVEQFLDQLEPAKFNPESFKEALEAAGQDVPLSGAWIVHLFSHLREWTDEPAIIREWLMCKLESGTESLDRIISYEHLLQANLQVSTGNIIGSLRKLERWNWYDLFEKISLVERTLQEETTGDYVRLDRSSRDLIRERVEQLAWQMRVPENLIAKQAVELADSANESDDQERGKSGSPERSLQPRRAFAAYYLLDPKGIKELRRALRMCSNPRPVWRSTLSRHSTSTYFTLLSGIFLCFLIGFMIWMNYGVAYSPAVWAGLLILLAVPASEWAVHLVHWLIERVTRPRPLLRYDFSSGIPEEASTLVVIPVIWSTPEEVRESAHRLEIHYLANRESNLHFALAGDFVDAEQEHLPSDQEILTAAEASISALNTKYSLPGKPIFHLFHRSRRWNSSEQIWMGWERKRGKLVELVELLRERGDTSYDYVFADLKSLSQVRYMITLDEDTQLPIGSAQRMIGTLHLPYNRPRLNAEGTRVVEGYGVLQPRISISHEASMRSRLAYLLSGEPGIDPYVFAASDPYQDAMGKGIFTGKGIFDIDVFAHLLCDRIPDNTVLSHDLLEGGFLRAGLLSDIELVDDHPSTFFAYQKRLHRWVRGDWQLLCWLYSRVCDRKGALMPVDLSALTRWQIIDNMRRSLLVPGSFLLLLFGFSFLAAGPARLLILVFAALCLPFIRQCTAVRQVLRRPKHLLFSLGQVLITVWTMPYQTVLLLDAMIRSLYRQFISKRHLLEWVSSAEVERRNSGKRQAVMPGMLGGYALILIFAVVSLLNEHPGFRWTGLFLAILWALAPLGIGWLDQPATSASAQFKPEEEENLKELARQIWMYFEDFANEENHWLPPDNVQMESLKVAHRTSPTNIGFQLTCTLAARDFGFIDTPGLIERLERTLATIERMEKWNGHLYNWYDTVTLAPLPPLYVSTVDSGNLVTCMIVVKEGLAEWLQTDHPTNHSMNDLTNDLTNDPTNSTSDLIQRGQRLLSQLESLIAATDFRPLYDHSAKLFTLGYHVAQGTRENILYDLLASEARLASFVAIALGQVSVAHWFALGRTMTRVGKRPVLLSWSGTMFEYTMPWLFMRTYRHTIWDSTYRGAVKRQIEYAHERGVPFGISESGYYAFDFQMNYQYRAFGVPGLGFKRGLEQDLVVAPYAAIMALPFAERQGLEDLAKLESMGVRGTYGFYEAVDYTPERMPENSRSMIIRSFMAHHQGMSLLTLANLLLPKKVYDRFHQDKRVQSAELLLKERIPARPAVIRELATVHARSVEPDQARVTDLGSYVPLDTITPEVSILSNGSFMTAVTNSGSGFSQYNGMAISRWREDPVADNWGQYMYIREVTSDQVWSPTYQPCRVSSAEHRIRLSLDRARFTCKHREIETKLDLCVSPEWNAEVRRLTVTNHGSDTKIIEVTTYLELVLAGANVDLAHPAFTKLFVETEYDATLECLLAHRRKRNPDDEPVWAVHALVIAGQPLGPVEYETDRARFIGHGYTLAEPQGIRSRLNGTVGAVADPAFIMRRRVNIDPGQQVQLFAVTGVADTREEATNILEQLSQGGQIERSFQLAWTRTQIELRHLHLTAAEAKVFRVLAGRILYTSPLRDEQRKSIAINRKGQKGLWAQGISGDRPIVLVTIESTLGLPFIAKLLSGYEYLRSRGVHADLVILNKSVEGYQQELQESLQRTIEHHPDYRESGRGSVFVLAAHVMSEEEKALLYAVSRVILRADGPSIRAQLQAPKGRSLPNALPKTAAPKRGRQEHRHAGETVADEALSLQFYNGYGGFADDGREYQIQLKNGNHLPAPWINVMANPRFGSIVSEHYSGYTWWKNSREYKLTPWTNDPVLDRPGEVCYIRDEDSGEYWQPTPSREAAHTAYTVVHGQGYTRYEHLRDGIQTEMDVFVPLEDPVKVIRLRLYNKAANRRTLAVTYYAEWVLGVWREANASQIVTEWNDALSALIARNTYQETFRDANAFLTMFAESSDDIDPDLSVQQMSWTSDRLEFLGRYGTTEQPAAMSRHSLSKRTGTQYDTCGAIQAKLKIEPGSEQIVYILLGCEESNQSVEQLVHKYRQDGQCDHAFDQVRRFWGDVLEQISVSTPSHEMDIMLNHWLLYQTLACRMWSRTAFYQAGGAYGFRDQLQDSLALLHCRPDLTRQQILIHAAHQYKEGDVQHWWHEETESGIRTRYSDDLLWLPYVVSRYVMQTNDDQLLEETVPYIESELLRPDEHERYEQTVRSEESGTIYDHCCRAIDHALRLGEHGLPLIGGGDWNDGMNLVGAEGRGESVWLGWFLIDVLRRFTEIIERHGGDAQRAERYRMAQEALESSLNEHAWDGQWYRRAHTDHGQWLGSIHNTECRIDAIAQSWSVISGAAPHDRALQAMNSFDRELVDYSLSVAHLLSPPFDKTEPSPGYIQGYPPGIRENGGQYTHGVIWSIIAWCQLGNGNKAFELFHLLNPITHTETSKEARKYVGEPYVMAADVYTKEPHQGHAGWTWYTGAAGWMYQAGIEWILGIRRQGERLYIQPCIPAEWPEYTVHYRYGRAQYHIIVKNPSHKMSGCTSLTIDGQPVQRNDHDLDQPVFVELQDDGQIHDVILTM